VRYQIAMSRRQQSTEKATIGFGRPRGWRPCEDEPIPIEHEPAHCRAGARQDDDDDDVDEAPDYGIRIIWGEGKRRPGERLERIAARR
jgi:hypothetical protein